MIGLGFSYSTTYCLMDCLTDLLTTAVMGSCHIRIAGGVGYWVLGFEADWSTYQYLVIAYLVNRHLSRRHHRSISSLSFGRFLTCLLYTSPSPRDKRQSRMPSSA